MFKTKQEIISEINRLDIERVKLIGALELLEMQEKDIKEEVKPAE